ncbi:MAG TPA: FGGY family carbohydrate kinase [Actinomycetota bacterium]|nr:FGGY family carbohydrate kinase [Actinomycetota bacterium]
MELVVGIDVATAEVRVLAADLEGRVHASARAPLPPPVSPQPGWVEQDASPWWPTVATALQQLTGQLGPAAARIAGVSVAATSATVVALDRDGEPLGPALTYADQRAVTQARAAQEAAADRWAALGLRIGASFGIAKWAWLMTQPEIAGRAARLAHVPEVVLRHLVGDLPPTDWSHALKSGYDPLRGEWALEAMEAVGVPADLLPPVGRPTAVAGTVCQSGSQATGLPAGCPVRLGMTDSCASQIAAGAELPGHYVSVLGSTLVLKGASPGIVADPAGAVYSHRHPEGWWLPGGASSAGARALAVGFPGQDLARLDAAAAGRPASVIAYPLVGRGERFPFTNPDAEAFLIGDPVNEAEHYRALLEGVAFVERLCYERLATLGAPPPASIAVTGGGSTSRVWNRIRAAVLGRVVSEKPGASTALGAAILAAAGGPHADLAAATPAMAVGGVEVEPDGEHAGPLEENYRRFVAALVDRGWLPAGPDGAAERA